MLRSLMWITAAAACLALVVDSLPSDPVRAAAAVSPARRPLLVYTLANRSPVPSLFHSSAATLPLPPQVALALDGMAVRLPQILELLDQAATCQLSEAKSVSRVARFQLGGRLLLNLDFQPAETRLEIETVHLNPTWDLERAFPRFRGWINSFPINVPLYATDGVVVETGPNPTLQRLWETYRSRPSLPGEPPLASPRFDAFGVFFPTSHFHPLGDDDPVRDHLVQSYLESIIEPLPTLLPSPGGLICLGNRREQRLVQRVLEDPQFTRLMRQLLAGSVARQNAAWDAALHDPNPRIALVALKAASARDPGPDSGGFDPRLTCPAEPAAADVADALRRVCEGPALPDHAQGSLLRFGMLHRDQEVRRAASAIFLERLPAGVLQNLDRFFYEWRGPKQLKPPGLHKLTRWTRAEREELMGALLDRLRDELATSNADPAATVLGEALYLCDFNLLRATSAARSRVLELGAELLRQDLTLGNALEVLHPQGAMVAAEELSRSSDPDTRRAAWALMRRLADEGVRSVPDSNDPILDELKGAEP